MREGNRHRGSSVGEFLREQAIVDAVQAAAVKRALAEAVVEATEGAKISNVEMARRMGTSRSQLDRVLDPAYAAVQLDTLIKAASAVGCDLRISLKRFACARSCRWPTARATESQMA